MNISWIVVLLSVVPQFFAAQNELPNCLKQFIDEAFQRDTKTVYLIGLQKLNSFEAYVSLPYPKVILNQNETIRSIDATCLVVLYLDFSKRETLYHPLAGVLENVGKYSSTVKFVVLGDDGSIRTSSVNVLQDIGSIFNYYGMPYWCIAAHSGGFMYYAVMLANTIVLQTKACDVDKIFGIQRVLPLKDIILVAQYASSFPYTFPFSNNRLGGLDANIFQDVFDHLEANITLKLLGGKGLDQFQARELAEFNLNNGHVDFMLTRKLVNYGRYEVVYIPENVHFCLVVPHSSKVDLTSSLVRPFDGSLWAALGVALGVFQLSRLMLGKLLASLARNENWQTFTTIAFEWLSFILIESYLAQVTSFFMDFRFHPEPQTLEEFFATNIPIRLPEEHKPLLDRMEGSVASAIRKQAVDAYACAEFSENCAHLDRYVRAMYRIMHYQSIDPVTNRKKSYILKEHLFSEPWAYLFARGSSLRDVFAVYLERLYEAGIPQWYKGTMEEYIESPLQRQEESLRLEHLSSLWMLIIAGWVVATVVFIIELVLGHFKINFQFLT